MRKNQGQLRIIGGTWRSRKLPILDSEGLRPTTDRIRETVFNWLQFDIADATVIDLFAGSGGLGFEAASRGAAQVVMIEKDSKVAASLSSNIKRLDAANIRLHTADAIQLLNAPQQLPAQWDLVFVDPPFNHGLAQRSLSLLAQHSAVHEDTLVYVECERNAELAIDEHWTLLKDKTQGAVRFCLLQLNTVSKQ